MFTILNTCYHKREGLVMAEKVINTAALREEQAAATQEDFHCHARTSYFGRNNSRDCCFFY